ncbi:MAG: phosphomannomutase/phosphoglucomutase [Magnetococcales bacterium]|nr:phosphomannomutase/phosphoglucomutase [Magnetococcales bacterium]MBF0157428.1 phosphomannomutase/phosphoglucomutase [Magnetococcales bacterium]
MKSINPHIFREYDIRGVVGRDLTESLLKELGMAFAGHVREASGKGDARILVVTGRDGRISSSCLSAALVEGLAQGGVDVIDVGLGPSPHLYFATHHFAADAGIMLTGSHNPPDYNGLKMGRAGGSVYGAEIQELKARLERGVNPSNHPGKIRREDILELYLDRVAQGFRPGRPLKVVLDCGNGAAGVAAASLLKRLPGITGDILFAEVDGSFPNHHPDPTLPENLVALRQRMVETGAELGIAFDGDGDRLGALDDRGRIVWGDRLMILFAREILKERPGATIIGDAKCSQLLFDAVAAAGGKPLMWKTGHSLIKSKMRETGAPLAGEMSGHLFFADRYLGYDDALYGAVRLMELVAGGTTPLSARLQDLPEVHATPELRIDCPDHLKFQVMAQVKAILEKQQADISTVDGVRVKTATGWWLLRVSNTQPALVARVEANSRAGVEAMANEVAALLLPLGVTFPAWETA